MSEEEKEKIGASSTDKDEEENKDVEVKEKKTRKIQINVSRDKEIEALQKELAKLKAEREADTEKWEEKIQKLEDEKTATSEELTEKQAILEKQALEQFEKEKKEILELAKSGSLTDEQMAEIEEKLSTPKNLEIVKGLITMLAPKQPEKNKDDETGEKKPPAGKPVFTPPKNAKEYENPQALIDDLYNKAYYDPNVTMQEREEARKKIDKLYNALFKSPAWEQMKRGRTYPEATVRECPRCHEIIIGTPTTCPKCGYDLQQKLRWQGEVERDRGK